MITSFIVILYLLEVSRCTTSKKPNIVILIADDLGYNDVSWKNQGVSMKALDKLANSGVILEAHYSEATCTPSRGALLTGRYPVNIGLNPGVIYPKIPAGMAPNVPTLAEVLRDKGGYTTYAVGKWHLGFCNKKYLPTNRGFDHHYGFWLGAQDYYHRRRAGGYDLRSDLDTVYTDNIYSTELLSGVADKFIKDSSKSDKPMFLYVAFQTPHTPLQSPKKFHSKYRNIHNKKRRTYLQMVLAMDEAVKHIVESLEENRMLNNSIIVFMSDNGGPTNNGADNSPLRGSKGSLMEGGTRTPAFVWSSKLKNRVENRMFHITDWFPTLLQAAEISSVGNIDGYSQWKALQVENSQWPRNEFLYGISSKKKKRSSAIRVGDFKYYHPGGQLYNITADIKEKKDLSKTIPELRNSMESKMNAYLKLKKIDKYPKLVRNSARYWNNRTWTHGWCE